MEPDKGHIRYFCFVFTKRKLLLMHTELFVSRMVKM